MKITVYLGERGVGKSTSIQSAHRALFQILPRDVLRLGSREIKGARIHLHASTSDESELTPDSLLQHVKLLATHIPELIVVEVDSVDLGRALIDYFPDSILKHFSVCDSEYFDLLSEDQQALAKRFASLPIAIHSRAFQQKDAEKAFHDELCKRMNLTITTPSRSQPFLLQWQAELMSVVGKNNSRVIQLISKPGQGKSVGVRDVAAAHECLLVSVDVTQFTQDTWGGAPKKLAQFLGAVSNLANTTPQRIALFIDEADSLFPSSGRDTDIASEVRSMKQQFNKWLESIPGNLTVIFAANNSLEESISSRAIPIQAVATVNDLTNILMDRWPVKNALAQEYSHMISTKFGIDMRNIDEIVKRFPDNLPSESEIINVLETIARPRPLRDTADHDRRISDLETKTNHMTGLMDKIRELLGELRGRIK